MADGVVVRDLSGRPIVKDGASAPWKVPVNK